MPKKSAVGGKRENTLFPEGYLERSLFTKQSFIPAWWWAANPACAQRISSFCSHKGVGPSGHGHLTLQWRLSSDRRSLAERLDREQPWPFPQTCHVGFCWAGSICCDIHPPPQGGQGLQFSIVALPAEAPSLVQSLSDANFRMPRAAPTHTHRGAFC